MSTNLGLLRIIGLMEGVSYILLGVAMILKYGWENETIMYSTGMAHGMLFVLYVFLVLLVTYQLKWSIKKCGWALFASLVPLGTFVADKHLFRPTSKIK